jgi:lysozyme
MTQKVSSRGIAFIEKEEGVVLHVYLDSVQIPTAGCGHVLTTAERKVLKLGDPITQEQCDKWLKKDIAKVEDAINSRVTVPLTQNQFDALASLAFNIGVESFKGSTLVKKLNKLDYHGAAQEFLKWNHAGGEVSEGLTNRRKREAVLFLIGTPTAFQAAPGITSVTSTQGSITTSSPPSEERAGGDARNHPREPPALNNQPTPSQAPTSSPKTVQLPPSTGGTAQATKLAWQLPAFSTIFVTVISSIQSLVDHGYLKADEIGSKVFAFFIVNWQFVVYLAVAVIGYLCVKKCLSYVPSIIQFINHSDKSTYDVNFVPHGQEGQA